MKKLIEKQVIVKGAEVVEEDGGLITLLGKQVLFQCMNYNYIGKLTGVNTNCIQLDEMKVVFETGPYTNKTMKTAELIHNGKGFIMIDKIESYWEV